MFITNSPAPSRINSAELPQRDVTVWEFAIFGYFPCIIRTVRTHCRTGSPLARTNEVSSGLARMVRTRSFNHKHKHRKMAIFCYFFSHFFLFLELGIFLFKLGKKHTFWHWEHDRISVVKTGQKKPWFLHRFSEKLKALYQFHLHYQIGQPISKRYQKTAKQNSLNCIREALPNTSTLNFKIHKNLHWMVG